MLRDPSFPFLFPASGEDDRPEPTWPPDDAAFARLLLSLVALPPPPPGTPVAAPPASMPAQDLPGDIAAPSPPPVFAMLETPIARDPAPQPTGSPPPRAEELPSPRTEADSSPSVPVDPPAPPTLPPPSLLRLHQAWDAEAGVLVWVRDGEQVGAVRGAVPPVHDPLATTAPVIAPPAPDLLLIG